MAFDAASNRVPEDAVVGRGCPGCGIAAPTQVRYRQGTFGAEEVHECLNCGTFYQRGTYTVKVDPAGLRDRRPSS